jgi:hypothetical protein
LNSELLECERLNQQLDELTVSLDFASEEAKSSEDVILKFNADDSGVIAPTIPEISRPPIPELIRPPVEAA